MFNNKPEGSGEMKGTMRYAVHVVMVLLLVGCATKLSPSKMPEIATSQMTGEQAVRQLTRLNEYSGQFRKYYPNHTAIIQHTSNGDGVDGPSAIKKTAPYTDIAEIKYHKYNPKPFKIGYYITLYDQSGNNLMGIEIDDGKELTDFMTAFYKLCPALRKG
jgi:hypothetical protein